MLFSTRLEMAQTGTEYERFVKQSHETAIWKKSNTKRNTKVVVSYYIGRICWFWTVFWFMTHEEQSRDHARDTGHVVCQDRQLHPNY